jgi:aerobic-type carbon monoxide dehydrogenase small subunit (CoxS/CutS family)
MAVFDLQVNGERRSVDVSPDMPLLWVLRDHLGLTGTKYSCGIAFCGSCTVQLDGEPVRTCATPVKEVGGRAILTIEGLPTDLSHPLQKAWLEEQSPQCGYCHPGQILQAAALLEKNPHPTDEEIDEYMAGNLCRCGTYQRIRKAIRKVERGEVR